jgi:CxxC motif-containing protein
MKRMTCIICPNGCEITIDKNGEEWVVEGNMCPKGRDFGINEMTDPKRSICSTVRTRNKSMPRLPVRTDGEIPKDKIFDVMNEINRVIIDKPVHNGDIIIENVLKTGINVIAESDMFLILEG